MESRKENETRQRPWLPALGALAVVAAVLVAVAYTVVSRCVAYNRIVRLPGASGSLASRPSDIELSYADATMPFAMGYARTALPAGWSRSISIQGSAVHLVGQADERVVLMPPCFDTSLSDDGNYSEVLATTRVERVPLSALLTMSPRDFRLLAGRTYVKALNSYNANGIGHFETDDVRGIIRFGSGKAPGDVVVEVWSKSGRISQGMLIRTQDAAAAFRLARCVLCNLSYTVDRVPSEGELQKFLQDEVQGHVLYGEGTRGPEVTGPAGTK